MIFGSVKKSIAVVLFLVTGITVGAPDECTTGTADGSTFKRTAGLMAYNCTRSRTEQGTRRGTALGIRTGRGCTVGEGKCDEAASETKQCGFHGRLELFNG